MSALYGDDTASTYDRAGFGAQGRRGSRPAILVVDVMRGFTEDSFATGADLTEMVFATNEVLGAARRADIPIFQCVLMYTDAEIDAGVVTWLDKAEGMRSLLKGSDEVQFDSRLEVAESDVVVEKKGASAFAGTPLAAMLTAANRDTVIICGATTSGCIRATAVDAVQAGFAVLVAEQGVGDRAQGPHEAALFDIESKYGDVLSTREIMVYLQSTSYSFSAETTRTTRVGSDQTADRGRSILQMAAADLAEVPAVSRWVDADGLRLHVLDYGGEGQPIVFIPGITSPAISMDFIARELADLGRVVVIDARGRGFSDDGSGYSLPDYASDTEAVISQLQLDRPVLIGHSMGARVAAYMAARSTVRFGGVIIVDPPTTGVGRGRYPTTLEMFMRQLRDAQEGTTAAEVAGHWPTWPHRELELRARWLATCGAHAIAESHWMLETEDFFDSWADIHSSPILVYGGDSNVFTSANAKEALDLQPDAVLVEIADAGHMLFWDQPERSLESLRELLRPLVQTTTLQEGLS